MGYMLWCKHRGLAADKHTYQTINTLISYLSLPLMLLSNYPETLSSPRPVWHFWSKFFFSLLIFIYFFPQKSSGCSFSDFLLRLCFLHWIGLRWNSRPIPFVQLLFFIFLSFWRAIIHSLTVRFSLPRKHEVNYRRPGLYNDAVDVLKVFKFIFSFSFFIREKAQQRLSSLGRSCYLNRSGLLSSNIHCSMTIKVLVWQTVRKNRFKKHYKLLVSDCVLIINSKMAVIKAAQWLWWNEIAS